MKAVYPLAQVDSYDFSSSDTSPLATCWTRPATKAAPGPAVTRWAINVVIARVGNHVVIDVRGGCNSKEVSSHGDEESWECNGAPGSILAIC